MELTKAIHRVATEFESARLEPFAEHPLANFIRDDWADSAAQAIKSSSANRIQVVASPGKGRWNESPWLAYLDPEVTTSAQSGYYPVFLFEPGMGTYCLVLGQGAHSIKKTFGTKEALRVIASRAELLRNAVGNWTSAGFSRDTFRTLSRIQDSSQDADTDPWSQSVAFGKRYFVNAPPTEQVLHTDVQAMLGLYAKAVQKVGRTFIEQDQIASDLSGSGELPQSGLDGALKVSIHKRVERRIRNQKLAKLVKTTHGYCCQACQIDLARTYPALGKKFIEAHHVRPLSEAPAEGIELTVDDFCVLCPTCHRIIHRMGCPPLSEFLKTIPDELRAFHGQATQKVAEEVPLVMPV